MAALWHAAEIPFSSPLELSRARLCYKSTPQLLKISNPQRAIFLYRSLMVFSPLMLLLLDPALRATWQTSSGELLLLSVTRWSLHFGQRVLARIYFRCPECCFQVIFFKWSFLELWPSTVERVQCFHAGILGRELTIVQEVYTSVYSLGKWTVKGYIPRKSVITHWIHHRVRKPWTICWQGEDEDVLRSVFVPALTTY